jgi:hypothetical protein
MANFALSRTSVRSLKNALKDRFPTVKSAHLSEAIAATAGFRTHAALLAYTQSTTAVPIVFLDDKPFVQRLHQLGYPSIQPFAFSSVWLGGGDVPEAVRVLIARLLKLEAQPAGRYPEIYALRRECAALFAATFGIGYAEPAEGNKRVVKRLGRGIDHKACMPDWGDVVNSRHSSIDFPCTDHQVRFYERLPLSNGKYVEYGSAIVSMPYKGSSRIPELPAAQTLSARVGWQCTELESWSWYAAQATTLILFRRTTTHEEMLQMWPTSFKRWLIENKSRLLNGASQDRRNVINDAIDCPHMPLDVRSWHELRERYFKEFAPSLYRVENDPMTRAFKKVFDKWLSESSVPAASVA